MRSVATFAAFAATWLVATLGYGAEITKAQCVDANTSGQNFRREGKVSDARAQFLLCNDSKCPELVRVDCLQRFEEAEAAEPAIVFDVKGSKGEDLAAVQISADGKPLADKADGSPLKMDPGAHDFTFETAGQPPITRTFVLKEGEKLRRERISFAPAEPVRTPAAVPASATSPLRIVAVVAGAVGVAALGLGVAGGLEARGGWRAQQRDCASVASCRDRSAALDDHTRAETWGTVSSVGVVAGALLLAGGVVLFLTSPSPSPGPSATTGLLGQPFRLSF